MAAFSRKVGSASNKIPVFVPDATVSTGAGLANINASSVTYAFHRDDMAAISSGTCTTGTLGTYGVSSFVQMNSTSMLGWYEFGAPDIAFLSGSLVALHLYGAPSMAPVPVLVDLSSQASAVNTSVGVSSISTPVTVSSGVVSVSTVTIPVGVSTVATLVGVSTLTIPVSVSSISTPVAASSLSVGVNASTVSDKTGYGLTTAEEAAIADAILNRNVSSGANTGRLVKEALYVLRNKVDAGAGIVYQTDDTTSSWAFSVSTVAGNPIQVFDPA